MKKIITFIGCLLIASIGRWVLAQQAAPATPAPTPTLVQGTGPKYLYLRGHKTHLLIQPTRTGTRVYRQVGQRMVPMK